MNEQNLIPTNQRSEDEARALGRKGGIASGKARRIKSRGRKLIQDLLALRCQDPQIVDNLCREYGINSADLTNEVAMTLRQVQKATRKADTNAYNSVLRAAGIAAEVAPSGPSVGLQINVGTPEAAEGLRKAIATGAQPAAPENEQD